MWHSCLITLPNFSEKQICVCMTAKPEAAEAGPDMATHAAAAVKLLECLFRAPELEELPMRTSRDAGLQVHQTLVDGAIKPRRARKRSSCLLFLQIIPGALSLQLLLASSWMGMFYHSDQHWLLWEYCLLAIEQWHRT